MFRATSPTVAEEALSLDWNRSEENEQKNTVFTFLLPQVLPAQLPHPILTWLGFIRYSFRFSFAFPPLALHSTRIVFF